MPKRVRNSSIRSRSGARSRPQAMSVTLISGMRLLSSFGHGCVRGKRRVAAVSCLCLGIIGRGRRVRQARAPTRSPATFGLVAIQPRVVRWSLSAGRATMSAIIQQLGLVSESQRVGMSDLMRVAAALQKQASRDLAPIWDISPTVNAFEKLEDVPLGYWPLIVKDDIGFQAAGIHLDKDRQPFALIGSSADLDHWSLTASHEALEMLVDPFGDRLIAGDSPHYFDPVAAPGVRYSFTGAITQPRQVLRGGYLSWVEPVSQHWWQETWFTGQQPEFRDMGILDATASSLRSQIDRLTAEERAKATAEGREVATAAGLSLEVVQRSTDSKAHIWREQIKEILAAARG